MDSADGHVEQSGRGRGRRRGRAAIWAGLCLLALPTTGRALDPPEVTGIAEFFAAIRTDSDSQRERPTGSLWMRAEAPLHARADAVVAARALWGGPLEGAPGFGVFNIDDAFQNKSPSLELEEAYIDLFLDQLDLRIGKQKISWGRLDGIQPNDYVNPERYREFVIPDEIERKIGIPALLGTYYLPPLGEIPHLPQDLQLTGVWIPFAVPPRFPLDRERWFPPTQSAPTVVTIPREELPQLPPADLPVFIDFRTANRATPAVTLGNSSGALRLAGRLGQVDWALYYFNGFEVRPDFDLRTFVTLRPDGEAADADVDLVPRFDQIEAGGIDLAFTVGDFAVRIEAAYVGQRPLPRNSADLFALEPIIDNLLADPDKIADILRGQTTPVDIGRLYVTRDVVEWGIGADTLWKSTTFLLEVSQTIVRRNDIRLLIEDVETTVLATVRRSFWQDRVEVDFAALGSPASGYYMFRPEITYDLTDHIEAQVAYLSIGGERDSLIGQYRDNDEGIVRLRYRF